MTFTVLARDGERFKAHFITSNNKREIRGTIKDGRISWLAQDVRVMDEKSHPGHDYAGTIAGEEIFLEYSGTAVVNNQPVWGEVYLKLKH